MAGLVTVTPRSVAQSVEMVLIHRAVKKGIVSLILPMPKTLTAIALIAPILIASIPGMTPVGFVIIVSLVLWTSMFIVHNIHPLRPGVLTKAMYCVITVVSLSLIIEKSQDIFMFFAGGITIALNVLLSIPWHSYLITAGVIVSILLGWWANYRVTVLERNMYDIIRRLWG